MTAWASERSDPQLLVATRLFGPVDSHYAVDSVRQLELSRDDRGKAFQRECGQPQLRRAWTDVRGAAGHAARRRLALAGVSVADPEPWPPLAHLRRRPSGQWSVRLGPRSLSAR